MKHSALGTIAATLALAALATPALSATMMGNNSNKGSLLIFPRIDVRPGVDTFITLVNDASVPVTVKCYYRSSEPLPTPLPTSFNTSFIKHTMDFSFNLTHNQPVTWSAATGMTTNGAQLAQAFTLWPDGAARQTGELKCWALGVDSSGNVTQINFNQLFGTAAIVGTPFGAAGQAYEYNAWAFQALGGTSAQGQPVGATPGTLPLDGTINGYDLCPNILLADFQPRGAPPAIVPGTAPTIVANALTSNATYFPSFLEIAGAPAGTIVTGPPLSISTTTPTAADAIFAAIVPNAPVAAPGPGAAFTFRLDTQVTAGAGHTLQLIVQQGGDVYARVLGTTGAPAAFTTLTFNGVFDPATFTHVQGTGPAQPVFDGSTPTRLGFAAGSSGGGGTVTALYQNLNISFVPTVIGTGLPATQLSIAACNQDLTQRARPFITKYTYTFWNEDEFARTGTHECGDSYYETSLPATGGTGTAPNGGPFLGFPLAQFASLGTGTAYMRIESVADTFVCANAVQLGMVGVVAHSNGGIFVRGSNMIGRGTRAGSMTYDVGPADSFKR